MDFNELFNAQMIFVSLVTFGIVSVIKHFLSEFKNNRFVKSVVLPSLSVCVGALVGLWLSTVPAGIVAGAFASLIFNRFKSFVKNSGENK